MAFGPTGSRFRSIPGSWGAFGTNSYGSVTIDPAGTQNALVYTSVNRGAAQNAIRVRYVVAGTSTALSVSVSGTDITVNVATDGGGAATSTAAQVRAAVNAHAGASALVTATLATGNDGTGVVAAVAFTALTGGTNWTIGTRR